MTPYFQQDGICIYHGRAEEVLPTLKPGSVDLVLTDPPFFMPARHTATRGDWQRSWGDTSILSAWWAGVIAVCMPTLRRTGHFITFCDDESYPVFYPELYRHFDLLNALVWDKGAIGMGSPWRHSHELLIAARWSGSKWTGAGNQSDVLHCKSIPSGQRVHPVDKPVKLVGQLIEPTTEPGDLVLDPFLGGGSVLVAAQLLGRRAIGIEIEERYCEIAARRLSQATLALEMPA